MNGEKKLIYFLVAAIILLAILLLVKIKTTPKYDSKIYKKIYDEYEDIFGKEDNVQKIDENAIQNSVITEENNTLTTVGGNIEQRNVIGKIIIPKIDIKYPIIKETTTEYLKVAPTKYYGPEVNEIREFSYSRS